MNFLDFNKKIGQDKLGPVYLFKGEENYLMDRYVSLIKDRYISEEFEMINYIEIKETDSFDTVLNACETLGFMTDKKLVFIKDIYENIDLDRSINEKLANYLDKVSEDIILIIADKNNRLKKNSKLYKSANKLNCVVDFDRLKKPQLVEFIKNILSRSDKEITGEDLNYFIEITGYLDYRSSKTLFELENELLKIIGHSKNRELARTDIDRVVTTERDKNIFNLIDSIMDKNLNLSLEVFTSLYKQGEPVQRIVYMLIRHFRLLFNYSLYRSIGYRGVDIGKKLKISNFEAKKISNQLRFINPKGIEIAMRDLLEIDRKQKTSSLDDKLAIEELLVKINSYI